MGIGDKGGMVATRNAQTEKNTSHSRRNKNFHAERYLSLLPIPLLDPRRHRGFVFFFHRISRDFLPGLVLPRDSSVSFPLPSPMSRSSRVDITLPRGYLDNISLAILSAVADRSRNEECVRAIWLSRQLFGCLFTSRIPDILANVEGL